MKLLPFALAVSCLFLSVVSLQAVEIIAHRGASHDAPENTLAAFRLAWEQGADACEVDVQLSSDGQIVAMHDPSTKRTAGVNKRVSDQSLIELRSLDAGVWKNKKWQGERIPTLAEALQTMPEGKRFFIEIKCGVEILPELGRVIKASGKSPEQLPIITFSLIVARRAKESLPNHEVSYLYDWKKDRDTGKPFTPDALIHAAKAANLDGLDLKHDGSINAAYVKKVKDAGLRFYVWTVDSPAIAKRMVVANVDAITTNQPILLRANVK